MAIDLPRQRVLSCCFRRDFSFHAYSRGLFQVNSGKLFNSIKCISRLKVLPINSLPDRESDQAKVRINMILLVIVLIRSLEGFLLF